MEWIVTDTVLGQLATAMQQRVQALTGVGGQPADWGYIDAEGNARLVQTAIDGWSAFLVKWGSSETVEDVVLDATGVTLAALKAKPATDLDVKLLSFVRPEVASLSFLDIDYVRQLTMGRPQRRNVFGSSPVDRGELSRVEWYESATPGDPPVYSNLLVTEGFAYTRNAAGLATERTQTITWLRNDESPHPTTKGRAKLYSVEEQVREAERRRRNIVSMARSVLVERLTTALGSQAVALAEITALTVRHQSEFTGYVDVNSDLLHTASIPGDAAAWLDSVEYQPALTLRDFLVLWFSMQAIP